MTRSLDASARIVAEAGAGGATALPELRSSLPLVLRRTGERAGIAEVHLVGGAAGPLGGDRWRLEVVVGPGAALRVRSAAASVALPGPDGAESLLEIVVDVAAGGFLDWAPEPLVAAAGARHTTRARVTVADGGMLRWRDEIVCGRHGEASGSARSILTVRERLEPVGADLADLTIRHETRPLLAHDVAVGPDAPGWDSPAVLGRARAAGCLLLVGCEEEAAQLAGGAGENFAIMRPIGKVVLLTALGDDGLAVGRILAAHGDQLSETSDSSWALSTHARSSSPSRERRSPSRSC